MICRALRRVFGTEPRRLEETCSQVLSLCNSKSIKDGICVHGPIIKLGLEQDLYLTNTLLSLYGKCCGPDQARRLFDEMLQRDIVSWTGLLSAYVRAGDHENALRVFDSMLSSGETPNEFTFSGVLRCCSKLGEFDLGSRVHACVIKCGFESNPILGSVLIELYSKLGSSEEGLKVFEYLANKDTVSWTTMISSLVESGKWLRALQLYSRMIEAGITPNEFTFVKLLGASSFFEFNYGMILHAQLVAWGINVNLILKTALVNMYTKNRKMEEALKALTSTPEHDVCLWTAIVSGLIQNSMVTEAVSAFHQMDISRIKANNFTYSSLLSASSSILSLELGQQIHSRVIKVGLEGDVSVGNSLTDMYIKCSNVIEDVLGAFRSINSPNVISWTSLIAGLIEHSFIAESFQAFVDMRAAGVDPNSFTLSTILKSCAAAKSRIQTSALHCYVIKIRAPYDISVGNALVDTYGALDLFDEAWNVTREMDHRDVITYTSLATRMNNAGHHETALSLIRLITAENIEMDEFSLASFLSAASNLSSIQTGRQLHSQSVKSGLGHGLSVSNGLVDLYGKCKSTDDARKAFDDIPKPNVVSWNVLISRLASNGLVSSALSSFEDMRLAGVNPDSITFLLVLSACSRGGLVDLALEYFHSTSKTHNIEPELEHYTCLVDLLGRAGRLEEAREVIESMPLRPDGAIYKKLLSACKLHRNVPLGEDMARRGLEVDPMDRTFYAMLADLYDASRRYDLGDETRKVMRSIGSKGNSSVRVDVDTERGDLISGNG
ncbi:pentatricopeptide repeat-containing protein At5g52850, chloroplastic [Punica granatum]|uniref:Pentatricopeptide repeat-containing protein At5g52850, chloroplastic n=2 Tax=Punica granatum TaxID=22663 RepID=A0A6P8DHW9_PUNGR|nr:pentatricopeptide repeat-containing protein At5g52850, chloroplastic [Punica granatum]PKI63492.1 hypothetical protein CRG98_016159 [Punica granatum]